MKCIKKLSLTLVILIMALVSTAQKPIVLVKTDVKRINVHELGLSEMTPISDVIVMFPEILSRPGDFFINNYTIEVNDVVVGDARDVVLSNLKIADVEFIEISENSINSFENNGQGGTMSIELRKLDNGVSGDVSLDVSYPLHVAPAFKVNYKNEKFSVRGLGMVEFYNPMNVKKMIQDNVLHESKESLTNTNFFTEMARAYLRFTPTEYDKIDVCLSENWSRSNNETNTVYKYNGSIVDKAGITNSTKKMTDLLVRAEYFHTFKDKSRFRFLITYQYTPNDQQQFSTEYYNSVINYQDTLMYTSKNHKLSGKLEYRYSFIKDNSGHIADLKGGVNYNFVFSKDFKEYHTNLLGGALGNISHDTRAYTRYLSPFVDFSCELEHIDFKASLDYQLFGYNVKKNNGETFDTPQNDLTGLLMFGWKITKDQKIRFLYNRKIKRPSNSQIYPFIVYNPDSFNFTKGNPDLSAIHSDELSIDYTTEVRDDKQTVAINFGVGYISVNDVIISKVVPMTFKELYEYTIYNNEGDNKILRANMMILYKRGFFSILATANSYNNIGSTDGKSTNHYTYINYLITPTFSFNYGWKLNFDFESYNQVNMVNKRLGSMRYLGTTVTKAWDKFSINAYFTAPLQANTMDVTYSGNETITYTYNYFNNAIYGGIGVRYQF